MQNDVTLVRLDTLLTMRVLATLAVVFGHSASFFKGFPWSQFPVAPYIQSQSVTVFFVVSGFTIAWVCDQLAKNGKGFLDFIFDRTVRLLVPLVPILCLIWIAESWLYDPHPYPQYFDLKTFAGNIFFLQGLEFGFPGQPPIYNPGIGPFGTDRPLWTISIEFWLYACFASLFFAIRAPKVLNILAILSVGIFGFLAIQDEWIWGRSQGLPLVWLVGAALYAILRSAPIPGSRLLLMMAPIALLSFALLFVPSLWPPSGTYSHVYNIVVTIAVSLFIWLCPALPARWTSVMRWAGAFAYTTYLAHYPVLHFLRAYEIFPLGNWGAVAAMVASIAVSFVLGLLFERHYKAVRAWLRGMPVEIIRPMIQK